MNNRYCKLTILFLLFAATGFAQDDKTGDMARDNSNRLSIHGFVRGGLYGWIDKDDNKIQIPSAFSDLALKIENEEHGLLKVFSDIRLRYGSEFHQAVEKINLREAYIAVKGKKAAITAGQQIIKWGKADFTSPVSRLSPVNLISRSPDPEDMYMGNLMVDAEWYPSPVFSIEAVAMPYYRPSTLIIGPMELPAYISIIQPRPLVTGPDMFSYGIKTDFHFRLADISISWFDGYDPMPGTRLSDFNLDMSGPIPLPFTELTMTPYRIQNLGLDFETIIGKAGLRGEAVWTIPYESHIFNEYVPLSQVQLVSGLDFSQGNWRFFAEYSGKFIQDFFPSPVDPVLGTEQDFSELAPLIAAGSFDLREYVRQQVGAFNRLYNYQTDEFSHSVALRIEGDLKYSMLAPSVFTMYNITSRDLYIRPEVKIKPADGFTINIGAEFYSGRDGSLFDLVDEFMNGIFIALKADF